MPPRREKVPAFWEVLGRREVFAGPPWVRVTVEQVRLPDGRVVDEYHQIVLPEFVVIVASTPDGRILVERQYKHGVRAVTLMLPAGMREEGEDPLACARRELLEETGYASNDWRAAGTFVVNGNYGCGTAHVFLARDVRRVAERASGDLEETQIRLMPLPEIARAIRERRFVVLSSVAALALATHPSLSPVVTARGSGASRQKET
jgi:ADP-ribose pyrophosphatase